MSVRPAGSSRALAAYRKKRDLTRSGEPDGGAAAAAGEGPRQFVIQKHDASRLHYDLRLEMAGVLRSWAVPKGLPAKPGEKVLAVAVEDHPLSYGDFEGTIPAGNYGAGTVMVWDRGHYLAAGPDPARAFREGQLDFALAGEKCQGEWTLVRMRGRAGEAKDNWLLIKRRDSRRGAAIKAAGRERSVKSGRTMAEIAGEKPPRQSSGKTSAATTKPKPKPKPKTAASAPGRIKSAAATKPAVARQRRTSGPPRFVEPMKAKAVTEVPPGEWHLEIKYDGFRALALLDRGQVELWSRNAKPWPDRFPEVRQALQALPCRDAILDGEIAALDAKGRPSFQLLQNETRGGRRPSLRYYLFDVLRLDGEDLTGRPIEERRARLAELLQAPPSELVLSPVFHDKPAHLLAVAGRQGLEGIIAKAAGSHYEPGRRSGAWLKCRLAREQEFVIGGFTPPQGSRPHFGALLVGYYDGKQLRYAGKVGTGFDARKLWALRQQFEALRQPGCPFDDLPSARRSRFGAGMTAAAMRDVTWLRPKLVAQIRFAEWTADGLLRQPVYLGLREDKPAREVVREALAEQ